MRELVINIKARHSTVLKDEKVAIDHIKTSDNQIEHEIEEKLSTIELEMRQRHSSLSPSSAALKTQLDLCKALVLNIELAREIEQNYLLLEQTERTITKKKSILHAATKSMDKSAFCKTCPECAKEQKYYSSTTTSTGEEDDCGYSTESEHLFDKSETLV